LALFKSAQDANKQTIEQKILFSKVSKLKIGEFLAAIRELIKKDFRLVFYVKSESNNCRD